MPGLILEVAVVQASSTAVDAVQPVFDAGTTIQRAPVNEPPFWRETRQFHQRATVLSQYTLSWVAAQCA